MKRRSLMGLVAGAGSGLALPKLAPADEVLARATVGPFPSDVGPVESRMYAQGGEWVTVDVSAGDVVIYPSPGEWTTIEVRDCLIKGRLPSFERA